MICDIYFYKDLKRGIERIFFWFVEEVGELSEVIRKRDKEVMEEEFVDVFVWFVSFVNLFGIDFEEVVKKKYFGVCLYCGKNLCECEEKF